MWADAPPRSLFDSKITSLNWNNRDEGEPLMSDGIRVTAGRPGLRDGIGRMKNGGFSIDAMVSALGIRRGSSEIDPSELPFTDADATVGCENEFQAVVKGRRYDVDLPLTIERSNYFSNIVRRAAAGESPRGVVSDLEKFLDDNRDNVWENSWVRFPVGMLGESAARVLDADLREDKRNPDGPYRGDFHRFFYEENGERHVRVPVSYLLKLALADAPDFRKGFSASASARSLRLLGHFLNDNTSPEIFSFHIVPMATETGMGRAVAKENAKRFLLIQLLTMYANEKFGLRAHGQEAMVYFSPQPPVRQKELNDCISDAFYRDLFMNPCLSGWDRGEAKHRYMELCHQVLSRSRLNAVGKLREAGIITRDLVVLPNLSNVSLANNGTHISLGSLKLTELVRESKDFGAAGEKYVGDLVAKIMEHFLPLFVGTYSGAPTRIDFDDFHPEKVLGFLPHELDYTHLRMIWRRWKGKAGLKVFGRPLTPFGPRLLDRFLGACLRLKGDFIPDGRLIDYFVALMSTERSPSLDGIPGNGERLKQDLADLGVFDRSMAVYSLYRLRETGVHGYSGFEGRYYSIFESFEQDLGRASELQCLLTALAFKYAVVHRVGHAHIPDGPSTESERRQIFFGSAVGIPTFYVQERTNNRFLKRILDRCERIRNSRRYPGALRVYNKEYLLALVRCIREDGADLVEMMGLGGLLDDLVLRIEQPEEHSASGRITRAVLGESPRRKPFGMKAKEFNRAAESFYRDGLRRQHMDEAFRFLLDDFEQMAKNPLGGEYGNELSACMEGRCPVKFVASVKEDILDGCASLSDLAHLIEIMLIAIDRDAVESDRAVGGRKNRECNDQRQASIYRTQVG